MEIIEAKTVEGKYMVCACGITPLHIDKLPLHCVCELLMGVQTSWAVCLVLCPAVEKGQLLWGLTGTYHSSLLLLIWQSQIHSFDSQEKPSHRQMLPVAFQSLGWPSGLERAKQPAEPPRSLPILQTSTAPQELPIQ